MLIDAVTICVQYNDFLAWSLPSAKNIFNRLIVVSSKDDKETKKICDYYWVQCIQTDVMTKDGKFNKGLGINLGLDLLNSKEFVCHYDSDIVFPPRFSEFLRCKTLDKDAIYGVDRLQIKDWDTWINFCCSPQQLFYVGSLWANFPIMYRCVRNYSYCPIGFFQLWNAKSKYAKRYPENSNTAADSDLSFVYNWPAEKRILMPEMYVYHLESNDSSIGANWEKRTTKRFGPN